MERPALAKGVTLHQLDHHGSPTFRLVGPAGQQWQVRPLLYHVAVHADGTRTVADLARLATESMGSPVRTEDAALVVRWLADRGLIEGIAAAGKPEPAPGHPFGQVRRRLFSGPALTAAATGMAFLFRPRWVVLLLLLSLAVRLPPYATIHGLGILQLITTNPWSAITPTHVAVLGSIMLAVALLHELGHAAAARAVRMNVREIGIGLNVIYPICYTRIDDIWAGTRQQRFAVSAGGIYFQFLAGSLMWSYYLIRPDIPWALLALVNDLTILSNFQPFLRFDGYWMLSHLFGIVNLARRGWGQVLEWITLGRVRDDFLRTYGPVQRLVVAVYGVANAAFVAAFSWGLIRWSGLLLRMLPGELLRTLTEGPTAERAWILAQGVIWSVLVLNVGRRLYGWLAPLLRRQVARHVA
mgnify:CR=1 FL=1